MNTASYKDSDRIHSMVYIIACILLVKNVYKWALKLRPLQIVQVAR